MIFICHYLSELINELESITLLQSRNLSQNLIITESTIK